MAQSVRDVLTVNQLQDEIKALNMELTLPMELINQHQLVIKKVDSSVMDYEEENIINEIYRTEPSTKNQIESIYLMKVHNIIKIKFRNITVAKRIKEEGVRMFGWICRTIEFERSNIVKQCFKCYSYDHPTSDCTASTPICSECSSK